MNIRAIVAVSVVLFNIIIISTAQTEPPEKRMGKILGYRGQKALIIRGKDEIPVDRDTIVYPGDKIRTGPASEVGVEIELESTKTIIFNLRPNAEITVENLRLLAGLKGKVEIETKGEEVECTVNTAQGENIGISGTHFMVTTWPDTGTIVDVLDGHVKLTREGEVIGSRIIRDYKALIPADEPITIISPSDLKEQTLSLPMRIGLSAVMPGIGKIHTGRSIEGTLATKVLSISALVGLAVCDTVRENAAQARITAYNDYKTEIKPDKIEEFYDRHRDNVDKARRYRRLRNGFALAYGLLSVYETVSTIRDSLAHRKMIKNIEVLEDKLQSPKIVLEIRDDAVLSKASWGLD